MLERLIAEDKAGAEELFHEIVVEKSREIYSSILESEEEVDEADEEVDESDDEDLDEATDEEVDESDEDLDEATDEEVDESDDEDLDEMFGLDEFEVEADPMAAMGGDATDDMMGDMEPDMGDEEGDDEEGAEGPEEAIADLKDALASLEAEFEKMMGDEDSEGDDMDDMGDDEEGEEEPEEEAMAFEADEEVEEASDEEVEEAADKSAGEIMREYVNKMSATMGDNGANTKSTVAGKNDMGGTAANIAGADTSSDPEVGKGKKVAGSALNDQSPKEDNAGNRNTKGGTSAKSGTKSEPGHGAEKKGKPEQAANKKSITGS